MTRKPRPSGEERKRQALTRRDFAIGGAALLGGLLGCGERPRPKVKIVPEPPPVAKVRPADASRLRLLEVKGTPFEMGQAIGRELAGNIRSILKARAAWWKELSDFAGAQKAAVDKLAAAARSQAPEAFEELGGLAAGSDLPERELLVLNLQAELACLRDQQQASKAEASPGCSTIVLRTAERALVAHNEDGDQAYLKEMVLLRLRPKGKPSVLAACYPGLLPGNAPWINERGVAMTCNFIYGKTVKVGGVGRLFIHRQTMLATDAEQAAKIAAHPERAYSYHCLISTLSDARAISLELTPARISREDAAGVYLHTNHLVHEALAGEPQDPDYVGASSLTRWNALKEWKATIEDVDALTADDLVSALSSHQGRPHSPCRHPEGEVRGATVLSAVFDLRARALRLYREQPCQSNYELFSL